MVQIHLPLVEMDGWLRFDMCNKSSSNKAGTTRKAVNAEPARPAAAMLTDSIAPLAAALEPIAAVGAQRQLAVSGSSPLSSPSPSTTAESCSAPLAAPTWYRLWARGAQGNDFNGIGNDARLGSAIANIGDVDGSGTEDMAVSQAEDSQVWIVLTSSTGDASATAMAAIGGTHGVDVGILGGNSAKFGASIAGYSRSNGQGTAIIADMAIGAPGHEPASGSTGPTGGVSLVRLAAGGLSVRRYDVLEHGSLGFFGLSASVERDTEFGAALALVQSADVPGGPCNSSCATQLAVGAPGFASAAGQQRGAVFAIGLNGTGFVVESSLIDALDSSPFRLMVPLSAADSLLRFGQAVAWLGDTDEDGWYSLAVSTLVDHQFMVDVGAVLVLSRGADADATAGVNAVAVLNATNVPGATVDLLSFGSSLAAISDPSGCGGLGLLVGHNEAPASGGSQAGAVHILGLDAHDPGIVTHSGIVTSGCCTDGAGASIDVSDDPRLGTSVASGNFSGCNGPVIAVGAPRHRGGHPHKERGAVLLWGTSGGSHGGSDCPAAGSSGLLVPSVNPSVSS